MLNKERQTDLTRALYGPLGETETEKLIELSLSQVGGWRKRGDRLTRHLHQALSPLDEPERTRQEETAPSQSKLHASMLIHHALKNSVHLQQVVSAFEKSKLHAGDAKRSVAAFATIPASEIQKHTAPLMRHFERGDMETIEIASCLEQFIRWISLFPQTHFHFGPRGGGNLILTFEEEQMGVCLGGANFDDLLLVLNDNPSPDQLRRLETIKTAGKGKTGLTAPQIIALCQHSELASFINRFAILEFKLDGPESYGRETKRHQLQASHYLAFALACLQQSLTPKPFQPLLFQAAPLSPPLMESQLVYFGVDQTTTHTFQPAGVNLDLGAIKTAALREMAGQQISSERDQIRKAIALVIDRKRRHQEAIQRVLRTQGWAEAWETIDLLEDPFRPTNEIIRAAHQKKEISLIDLLILMGQINLVWEYRDGTFMVPFYDVRVEIEIPTDTRSKDQFLIIPPTQAKALVLDEQTLETIEGWQILDIEGNPISPELVAFAIKEARGLVHLTDDFIHLPFTTERISRAEIFARFQVLSERLAKNFAQGQDKYSQRARRYAAKRGIPPEFGQKYRLGCSVTRAKDLAAVDLGGPKNLALRLLMSLSLGDIWTREKPLLRAGFIGLPFYDLDKLAGDGERVHIGWVGRTYFGQQRFHCCIIPPVVKQDVMDYKIFLGDPHQAQVIVVCEGIFDSLSLRRIFDSHKKGEESSRFCVIGNVGLHWLDYLGEVIQETWPEATLISAFDRDLSGMKAEQELRVVGAKPFWPAVQAVIPDLPPVEELKDSNDLLLFLKRYSGVQLEGTVAQLIDKLTD